MNTTSYNHNAIGSKQKPLISNADFKEVLDKVKSGNTLAFDEALEMYSFETSQLQTLQHELLMQSFY